MLEIGFLQIVDLGIPNSDKPMSISSHDKGFPFKGFVGQVTVSGIWSSQTASPAMKRRIHVLYIPTVE